MMFRSFETALFLVMGGLRQALTAYGAEYGVGQFDGRAAVRAVSVSPLRLGWQLRLQREHNGLSLRSGLRHRFGLRGHVVLDRLGRCCVGPLGRNGPFGLRRTRGRHRRRRLRSACRTFAHHLLQQWGHIQRKKYDAVFLFEIAGMQNIRDMKLIGIFCPEFFQRGQRKSSFLIFIFLRKSRELGIF